MSTYREGIIFLWENGLYRKGRLNWWKILLVLFISALLIFLWGFSECLNDDGSDTTFGGCYQQILDSRFAIVYTICAVAAYGVFALAILYLFAKKTKVDLALILSFIIALPALFVLLSFWNINSEGINWPILISCLVVFVLVYIGFRRGESKWLMH